MPAPRCRRAGPLLAQTRARVPGIPPPPKKRAAARESFVLTRGPRGGPEILQLELRLLAELAQHPGAIDRVAARRLGAPSLRQPDGQEIAVGLGVERLELGQLLEVFGRLVEVVAREHDLRQSAQCTTSEV